MRFQITAALLMLVALALPGRADPFGRATGNSVAPPKEVGTTSMRPGNYTLTEQNSGRSYSLMVTDSGRMVLDGGPGANQKESRKQMLEKGMEQGAMQLFKSGAMKGF
ncbi:MAG TPA: hypothetical protein V6C86_26705 [Oculatellaceae cyanobacterium]